MKTIWCTIYTAIATIEASGGKIDPLIVLDSLVKDKVYDSAAGKNYLFQLSQCVPSTANVESYAKIVKEKFYNCRISFPLPGRTGEGSGVRQAKEMDLSVLSGDFSGEFGVDITVWITLWKLCKTPWERHFRG